MNDSREYYLVNLPTAQDCSKPTDSAFRRTQIEERTKRKAKEGTRKEGNRRPEGVRKTAWRNKTMPERRRAVRRISAGSRFVAVLGQSYSGWHGSPVGMQALHGSDADASNIKDARRGSLIQKTRDNRIARARDRKCTAGRYQIAATYRQADGSTPSVAVSVVYETRRPVVIISDMIISEEEK
ncbi:hypothetical protein HN011_000879 [Eciton burchellii]|nr:hypothetical protein HN011_000879 [Eciton burchellii]